MTESISIQHLVYTVVVAIALAVVSIVIISIKAYSIIKRFHEGAKKEIIDTVSNTMRDEVDRRLDGHRSEYDRKIDDLSRQISDKQDISIKGDGKIHSRIDQVEDRIHETEMDFERRISYLDAKQDAQEKNMMEWRRVWGDFQRRVEDRLDGIQRLILEWKNAQAQH